MTVTYPTTLRPQPRPRRRTGAVIGYLLGTLVLVIGAGVVGYGLGQRDEIRKANALLHPSSAASTTGKPAMAASPQTVLTSHGSGSRNTAKFATGPDWRVHWTYNCSGFGGQGNFVVEAHDIGGDANPLGQVVTNTLGTKGSDTSPIYDDPGQHYLAVNSECVWTITVTTG